MLNPFRPLGPAVTDNWRGRYYTILGNEMLIEMFSVTEYGPTAETGLTIQIFTVEMAHCYLNISLPEMVWYLPLLTAENGLTIKILLWHIINPTLQLYRWKENSFPDIFSNLRQLGLFWKENVFLKYQICSVFIGKLAKFKKPIFIYLRNVGNIWINRFLVDGVTRLQILQ